MKRLRRALVRIIETMEVTDHTVGGKLFAIGACITEQERVVCPAADALRDALRAAHG